MRYTYRINMWVARAEKHTERSDSAMSLDQPHEVEVEITLNPEKLGRIAARAAHSKKHRSQLQDGAVVVRCLSIKPCGPRREAFEGYIITKEIDRTFKAKK